MAIDVEKIITGIGMADEIEIMEYDFDECYTALRGMASLINAFIAEHGNRDSDSVDDALCPAEDQDDALIGDAMRLMGA